MKRIPVRIALSVLVVSLSSGAGGCKLPYQILSKLVAPKATPTPTPLPAKEIQAAFVQISDDRVRGEGDTSRAAVEVELAGTKRGEVAAARVVVKKIVDDLGTDLLPEKPAEATFESVSGDPDATVVLSVPMKNASRKAKLLKEVTADVELYTPALDPAALVTIPKFLGEAGKPVVSPVLKEAGIDVAILSPGQVEQEKKAYGDRKRDEAKKMGLEGEMLDMTVRMAVESFLSSSYGTVCLLKLNDPNGRIQDFVFLNPAGEAQGVNRSTESGIVSLGSQGEEPGPDWGLQVRLKTPKTFQRYSFTLRDVALP